MVPPTAARRRQTLKARPEQRWYVQRQLVIPRTCRPCRQARRAERERDAQGQLPGGAIVRPSRSSRRGRTNAIAGRGAGCVPCTRAGNGRVV